MSDPTVNERVCLVTGGSRGIGAAVASTLAAEGGHVIVGYCSNEAAAAETVNAIVDRGWRATATQMDVRDRQAVNAVIEGLRREHRGLDVLVNSAGVIRDGLLATQSDEDFRAVVETNLMGTVNCVRAACRIMIPRRRGSVVNLSSIAVRRPHAGQSNYSASKGAIDAFTRAMAVELAPKRIRVNAVAPGFTETDMATAMLSQRRAEIEAAIPLGRIGTPQEIAEVVAFLASDRARYVTGQVLMVDGGRML